VTEAQPTVTTAHTAPADLSPLVQAAQAGDEDAFRALYRGVQPGLLRYLRAIVGDDAEDVAAEAWLQIARDIRTFQGGEGFRGWAATIGRNRALDHLRRRRRRPTVAMPLEDLAEMPLGNSDAGDLATEALSTDAALALIRTLPRDQAEAVLLRVVMGLDAETAGRVLGKRAGAVRTAAYRGLRKLAERLDHLAPARPPPYAVGVTQPRPATPTGTR
jgi:RNA polymerase sigma-70 factor, ECF subfamily